MEEQSQTEVVAHEIDDTIAMLEAQVEQLKQELREVNEQADRLQSAEFSERETVMVLG